MTANEMAQMRRCAAIEGELRILEAIPYTDFSSARGDNLLGSRILKDVVDRVRAFNDGASVEVGEER